jgi:hypothetical protein
MNGSSSRPLTVVEALIAAAGVIREIFPEWSDDRVKDGIKCLLIDDWTHEEMAMVMVGVLDYPPEIRRGMIEQILTHPGLHGFDHNKAERGM